VLTGVAGQIVYDPATGLLRGDTDGDGRADFVLLLDGAPAIGAGDFLF
jgi:hypothetical protein